MLFLLAPFTFSNRLSPINTPALPVFPSRPLDLKSTWKFLNYSIKRVNLAIFLPSMRVGNNFTRLEASYIPTKLPIFIVSCFGISKLCAVKVSKFIDKIKQILCYFLFSKKSSQLLIVFSEFKKSTLPENEEEMIVSDIRWRKLSIASVLQRAFTLWRQHVLVNLRHVSWTIFYAEFKFEIHFCVLCMGGTFFFFFNFHSWFSDDPMWRNDPGKKVRE